MTKKYALSIFLIISISFAWGYKGESIVDYFRTSSLASNININETPSETEGLKVKAQDTTPQNNGSANNLGKTLESITPGQIPFERVDRANKLLVDSNKRIEDFQGGVQNIPPPPPAVDLSNSNQQDVYRNLSAGINPGFQQNTPSDPDQVEDDDLEEEPDDAEEEDSTDPDTEPDTETTEESTEQTDLP